MSELKCFRNKSAVIVMVGSPECGKTDIMVQYLKQSTFEGGILVISNNPAKYSDVLNCVVKDKFDDSDLRSLRKSVITDPTRWPKNSKFNAIVIDGCQSISSMVLANLLSLLRTCNHQVFILTDSFPQRHSDIYTLRQVDSTLIVFPQSDSEMPIHRGKDSKGSYYQWGSQAKYYYTPGNVQSREAAKRKAQVQAKAIQSSRERVLYMKWA